jgi:hypothetical protein
MADEPLPQPEIVETAAVPAVIEPTAPEPIETTPEPVVVDATVEAAAEPAVETPAVPEADTLLGKKPEETVEEVEAAATEAEPPVPEPEEPIAYEPFKFPEGATPDETKVAALTELASQYRVPQEDVQKLVDMYIAGQQTLLDRMAEHQQNVWRETNEAWIDQIKKDREIGGNRLETVLARCSDVIDRFASTSRDAAVRFAAQDRLRTALNVTGAGNHPDIVRFLANVSEAVAPPQPIIAPRAMPTAPPSRAARRYANGNGAGHA